MATTWASCRRAVDDEGRVHDVENVLDRRRKGSGVAGCWTRQPPQLKCNIRDSARPRIWPAKNCTIAAGLGSRRPRADGRARAIQVTGLRQAEPGRIPCSSRREAVCPPAAAWRAATVEFRFVSLHLILDCLNRERTRCTYGCGGCRDRQCRARCRPTVGGQGSAQFVDREQGYRGADRLPRFSETPGLASNPSHHHDRKGVARTSETPCLGSIARSRPVEGGEKATRRVHGKWCVNFIFSARAHAVVLVVWPPPHPVGAQTNRSRGRSPSPH